MNWDLQNALKELADALTKLVKAYTSWKFGDRF